MYILRPLIAPAHPKRKRPRRAGSFRARKHRHSTSQFLGSVVRKAPRPIPQLPPGKGPRQKMLRRQGRGEENERICSWTPPGSQSEARTLTPFCTPAVEAENRRRLSRERQLRAARFEVRRGETG